MKNFVMIGAAGYIAPRHMKAIKDTGNNLIAALDTSDSVGVIDSYFPEASFFTEYERFDRHVEKLKRSGTKIDYLVVCSPNYLHDAHIRFGLRCGADVICEKPLVLNPWNIDALAEMEQETGKRIYTILQLRMHQSIIDLKKKVDQAPPDKKFDLDLTYITSRGIWYYASWKGNINKSGGIATNIGVHFFDMLQWVFGPVKQNTVNIHSHDRSSGVLELERATARWFLSISSQTLPKVVSEKGLRTYRSILLDGQEIEFSDGFTDLHTKSYEAILNENGFGLEDSKPAIEIVHGIRSASLAGLTGNHHPLAELPRQSHPFS